MPQFNSEEAWNDIFKTMDKCTNWLLGLISQNLCKGSIETRFEALKLKFLALRCLEVDLIVTQLEMTF